MFVVLFIVHPRKERFDQYLELAKVLKPELEKIDGFIDNERFSSRRTEGHILSLSTWRDEKALIRWRTLAIHHAVQEKGRSEVFLHYHLRVGEIIADTDMPEGHAMREQRLDATETSDAKAATISELVPEIREGATGTDLAAELGLPHVGSDGVVDQEVFESIYNPGKLVLLASWRTAAAADRWRPGARAPATLRHRRVRIIRDYGMVDRREAPQYYPPVETS